MKKIILLLLISTILVKYGSGQLSFGIKGGISLANAKEVGADENTYRTAFNAGVFVPVKISEKFSFQPELLYSVKGFKFPPTPFYNKGTTSLNYIAVPLLVTFNASKKFSVLVGPGFGFLTNAKAKTDGTSYDVSDTYDKFDIAVDLGIRYFFIQGAGIELRYCHGLKDIADEERVDNMGSQIANYRVSGNRVFQFNLVYVFTKNK